MATESDPTIPGSPQSQNLSGLERSRKHTPQVIGAYTVYPDSTVKSNAGWRGERDIPLTPVLDKDGYYCVRLTISRKRKKWRIHRLMAALFLSDRPSPAHEVRHLDGNRLNNQIQNLAWGTRKENADDRHWHKKTSCGHHHANSIKKAVDYARLDQRLTNAAYNAFDSAAKKLGVNAVLLAEGLQNGGIAELIGALEQAREHIDGEIDVVDGDYGVPAPNKAMSLAQEIDAALAKVKGGAL
jgi:hypothetical protein